MSKKKAAIQFQISSTGDVNAFTGDEINDDGYISIIVPATASHGDVRRLFGELERMIEHEDYYQNVQAEALAAIDEDISAKLKAVIKAKKKLKAAHNNDQSADLELYKSLSKYNDTRTYYPLDDLPF